MAELTRAQNELLTALVNVWREEQSAREQARYARTRAAEMLVLAHAMGLPAHVVARAYLRARARRTTTSEVCRALAVVRKRRERGRARDRASRRSVEPA